MEEACEEIGGFIFGFGWNRGVTGSEVEINEPKPWSSGAGGTGFLRVSEKRRTLLVKSFFWCFNLLSITADFSNFLDLAGIGVCYIGQNKMGYCQCEE